MVQSRLWNVENNSIHARVLYQYACVYVCICIFDTCAYWTEVSVTGLRHCDMAVVGEVALLLFFICIFSVCASVCMCVSACMCKCMHLMYVYGWFHTFIHITCRVQRTWGVISSRAQRWQPGGGMDWHVVTWCCHHVRSARWLAVGKKTCTPSLWWENMHT
jgi:hypothetical protein